MDKKIAFIIGRLTNHGIYFEKQGYSITVLSQLFTYEDLDKLVGSFTANETVWRTFLEEVVRRASEAQAFYDSEQLVYTFHLCEKEVINGE